MTQTKEWNHTEIQPPLSGIGLSPSETHRPANPISVSHHRRRCSICHHPDCHWIEEDFLRWCSLWRIRTDYNLPDRSSIYRHARAFGLLELRKRNLRSALELLIEQVEEAKPSATAIVRAIRAYTRLTDSGEWIDRPNHTVITHVAAQPAVSNTPSGLQPPVSSLENAPESAAGLPQPRLISSDSSSIGSEQTTSQQEAKKP